MTLPLVLSAARTFTSAVVVILYVVAADALVVGKNSTEKEIIKAIDAKKIFLLVAIIFNPRTPFLYTHSISGQCYSCNTVILKLDVIM